MEFAWVPFLFLSVLSSKAFASGNSERCYDVHAIFEGECVDSLKIFADGEGWFSGSCSPPYHLHSLLEGQVSIAATTPDKIHRIVTDSDGTPFFTTSDDTNSDWNGLAYSFVNDSLRPLSNDRKINFLEVDNSDNVYMTSSEAVYNYSNGNYTKLEGIPPGSKLFFEDSEGKKFFLGSKGTLWELKDDGSTRAMFEGENVWGFIEYPHEPGYLAATDSGLYHVMEEKIEHIYLGDPIYGLIATKTGTVCFTTPKSVYLMNSGLFKCIKEFDDVTNVQKISLAVDHDDKIYLLTAHAYVLKPREETIHLVTGIPTDSSIHSVTFDAQHNAIFNVKNQDNINQLYFLPTNSLEAHLVGDIKGSLNVLDCYGTWFYAGTKEGLYVVKSSGHCSS